MARPKRRSAAPDDPLIPADDLVEITAKIKRPNFRYLTERWGPPDYGIDRAVESMMAEPQKLYEHIEDVRQEVLAYLRTIAGKTPPDYQWQQGTILPDETQVIIDVIKVILGAQGLHRFGRIEPPDPTSGSQTS